MRVATFARVLLLLIPVAIDAAQVPPTPATPGTTTPSTPGSSKQARPTTNGSQTAVATIRGRVVRTDTGEPLRRVQIRAAGNTESRSAVTDNDGRYEITGLPAGSYLLQATRGGFVETQYGQRRPFRPGRPVVLAAGAVLEKVDFSLLPGGVIAGRILDDAGEPIIGASVSVSRPAYLNGRRQLISTGGDRTDDRGEFRIFNLAPGDYYVLAKLDATHDGSSTELGYASTYYPGTPSYREAQEVSLNPGEELTGVTFPLVTTRTASVSGVVRNDDGTPALLAMVQVRERPGNIAPMMGTSIAGLTKPDGSFVIANIPPGEYLVEGRAMTNDAVASTAAEVNVSGRDISGLTLQFRRGVTARGRIRFEGSTPPADVTRERIRLFPTSLDPEMFASASMPAPPREDWTFEITGLSGRRLIRGADLRGIWTIKSIRLDGEDVTDTPIDFGAGDVNDIDVLLTREKTDLSGTVTNDRGAPVLDATVIAFADDPEKWGPASRFVHSARLDQNGHFTLQGLPAGPYVVVALDDLEPGEERDPMLLEQLRSKGIRVTLRDGEKRMVDVKVALY
jgi:hypothetical protein